MMTLTVDLKMDCIRVLSVETELSDYMAGAFLDSNSAALEKGIGELHRQIEAINSAEAVDERSAIVQRLQFALGCSLLSALSEEVSGE
jgi:hypothetical protein